MERMFTWSWKPVGALATPTLKKNLRPVFSAAQARRGRGSVLAGSAFHRRGRKEVGQVEEELDGQGLVGSDTFSDSDNDTMVAWVEEGRGAE